MESIRIDRKAELTFQNEIEAALRRARKEAFEFAKFKKAPFFIEENGKLIDLVKEEAKKWSHKYRLVA